MFALIFEETGYKKEREKRQSRENIFGHKHFPIINDIFKLISFTPGLLIFRFIQLIIQFFSPFI